VVVVVDEEIEVDWNWLEIGWMVEVAVEKDSTIDDVVVVVVVVVVDVESVELSCWLEFGIGFVVD
jgi:hypothetical protein